MTIKAGMLFFRAVTPVHAGAGGSLSHIDLPIQREKTTRFPMIQSGGVKGALRSWCKRHSNFTQEWMIDVFGTEPSEGETTPGAGALGITDAKLLLLPVASEPGLFSLVTCRAVLEDWQTRLTLTGLAKLPFGSIPEPKGEERVLVANGASSGCNEHQSHYWLLDMPFTVDVQHVAWMSGLANKLADLLFGDRGEDAFLKEHLQKHLLLVHDEVFRDLTHEATEVRTRIRIDDDSGVVQEGALWTEEVLPPHAILYSLLVHTPRAGSTPAEGRECIRDLRQLFSSGLKVTQLGGDQTLGFGWMQTICLEPGDFERKPDDRAGRKGT